ncbi:DinB family protein (plasmid) [Micrococcaceae bacterium Sec5.7]
MTTAETPTWGQRTFGSPCRECEYTWDRTFDTIVTSIGAYPDAVDQQARLLEGQWRFDPQAWSATEYVCHVADSLRTWAERMAGVVATGTTDVDSFSPDALAIARRYGASTLAGALWALRKASQEWVESFSSVSDPHSILIHRVRGPQSVLEIARGNEHDALHHLWDLRRIQEAQTAND